MVEEFINLNQGNISVEEYSLKFSTLSIYAPSLVFNPRDKMKYLMMGVTDIVREKCRTALLHDNMTLDRVIVYAQFIEES